MCKVKWLRTHEEWYPSYPPLEECKKRGYHPNYWNPTDYFAMKCSLSDINGWHVSVWGADDFGMEIWNIDQAKAHEIFSKITHYTCIAEMKKLGMYNA